MPGHGQFEEARGDALSVVVGRNALPLSLPEANNIQMLYYYTQIYAILFLKSSRQYFKAFQTIFYLIQNILQKNLDQTYK